MAMGLMNSIVSIGTVTLQYAINGFGPLIISAQVAARSDYVLRRSPFDFTCCWGDDLRPLRTSGPNSLNA